ncbi:hypothetical protein [Eggerthella lenta]|uniref:hypothetical protein n=1 Tax=Eggerthella lenta TaxID=84112 RepID=UPI0018DB449D|nr:hypothetical protein [Eggerthella lenta]
MNALLPQGVPSSLHATPADPDLKEKRPSDGEKASNSEVQGKLPTRQKLVFAHSARS